MRNKDREKNINNVTQSLILLHAINNVFFFLGSNVDVFRF